MKQDNPFPTYYRLLRESLEDSDEIDKYDLVSFDPASMQEFNRLKELERSDRIELIRHILENIEILMR